MGRAALTAWDEARAAEGVAAIVADAEAALEGDVWPSHPLDEPLEAPYTGVYLGAAGMLWALRALGSDVEVDPLPRFRAGANAEETGPGLLLGEAGILAVTRRDDARLAELVRENERNPSWEVLWGSPGTAIAARLTGLAAEWRRSAELLLEEWERAGFGLWTQEIGGKPQRLLGAGHGFVSNVHALRGLVDDEELRRRVEPVLRRHAVWDDGTVNWPPNPGHPPDRTQWCHGAPGIVATIGDLLPSDLLLGAAEHTWRTGPLEKGPGLCHGTAGNGYALLRTWELTADVRWLERARGFAVAALEQVEEMRERYGRGRYTLFTGDAGVAVFVRACIEGDARFPILDRL